MGLTKDLGALPRVITVSGNNVGINTTPNASFMLDVNGTGRFSGNVRLSNSSNSGSGNDFPRFTIANTLATQGNGTSTYNFSDINISSGNGAVNMFIATTFAAGTWAPSGMINVSTNHDFQIRTNGTERMRIFSTGNVFIGGSVVDTGERLNVNGNVVSNNITRYYGTFNSGSSVSFPLKGGTQRARLILVHYYFSGNANINAARLMMVNTRNTLVGGGNSIAVISTTQNSTGTPNEPTNFTQSIGGSGENLTLVIGASMVGGSGSLTVEVQEVLA